MVALPFRLGVVVGACTLASALASAQSLSLPCTFARGGPSSPAPLTWAHSRARSPLSCSVSKPLAQQGSLEPIKDRVPAGEVVYVTDMKGVTIKGRLAAVVDDAVRLNIANDTRTIAATNIGRIQWQKPDSPLTGVLIGGAIGAIPGIYWLIADPNECTGMCPEDYASIATGATIGWLIDRSLHKKVTVYTAGPTGTHSPGVIVAPLATRDRKGVQVAVRF